MRKITGFFILGIILLIIFYDMYAIYVAGKDASVSQYIIDWSYEYPIATFFSGVVCGHLFWRMPDKEKK